MKCTIRWVAIAVTIRNAPEVMRLMATRDPLIACNDSRIGTRLASAVSKGPARATERAPERLVVCDGNIRKRRRFTATEGPSGLVQPSFALRASEGTLGSGDGRVNSPHQCSFSGLYPLFPPFFPRRQGRRPRAIRISVTSAYASADPLAPSCD